MIGRILLVLLCLAYGPAFARDAHVVTVSSNGWHTGISLPRREVPTAVIPEAADFPDAAHLEFGWGHAVYYTTVNPGIGVALDAALTSSPAVVHLIGLPDAPERVFPQLERVHLTMTPSEFSRLIGYLGASFDRGGGRRASPSANGLYPFSTFYPATGLFSLRNNCNTWIARALTAAGVPVDPTATLTADDLMAQLRPLRR